MSIPTVKVYAKVLDQQGVPVRGAHITMGLTTMEKYCGLVAPRQVDATTDNTGNAILPVWPNELGSEGSEYAVTISFPAQDGCGCGKYNGAPFQTQRFMATVPNADCNLQDIAELPPYEKRGSGAVVTAEIAQFAADAASASDKAAKAIDEISSSKIVIQGLVAKADTARTAAQDAASSAREQTRIIADLVQDVDDKITHFEASVTQRTESAAHVAIANASAAVTRAQTTALLAIENRGGEILKEIGNAGLAAQSVAVDTIQSVKTSALDAIIKEKTDALTRLHEDAELFGEDFQSLTERAEAAAKRAGCSAAAADKAASRACECAERAERAEENIGKVVLDAAAGIVSSEIINEAAKKAKEGALMAARTIWAPLAEQIIRLTDRHTRDMCHMARAKIQDARWRQKINELQIRMNNVEAGLI